MFKPLVQLTRFKQVIVFITSLLILLTTGIGATVALAQGAPQIMHYQGRLLDENGNLLGGAGTDYCFHFSFYDDETVGAPDTQIWPLVTPGDMTAQVRNGVFTIGIGDTSAGGDTLDYDFNSANTPYLNIEVATVVGGSCGGGDESYETLSPRQQILSTSYAQSTRTVFGNAQSAIGTTTAEGTAMLTLEATSTSAVPLFIRRIAGQISNLFSIVSEAGQSLFAIQSNGNVGIGTSTPYAKLSVVGEIVGASFTATTTATSTFSGGIETNLLNITSTNASSTFANGIDISTGCFAINGICSTSGLGDGTYLGLADTPGSFSANVIPYSDGSALLHNTSLTFDGTTFTTPVINATSTTATTTLSGGLTVDSETLVVDFSGNSVGIGTTSPSGQLGVAGLLFVGGTGTSTFENNLQVLGTLQTGSGSLFFTSNTISGSGAISLSPTTTSNLDITVSGGGLLAVNGNAFVIDSATGYVGVGTSSPYVSLAVAGGIVAGSITATSTTATSSLANLTLSGMGELGTIISGLWQGTAIAPQYGGTGSTSPAHFLYGPDDGTLVSTSTISQNFIDDALLRNAEINTFAELDTVVSDKSLANLNDIQTFSSLLTLATGYVSQASSTVAGEFTASDQIYTPLITVSTTTATSSFSNGMRLTGGCYEQTDGSCLQLSAEVVGSFVESLGGGDLNTLTATSVYFASVPRIDSGLTHPASGDNSRIQMDEVGWYRVSYTMNHTQDATGNTRNNVMCGIQLDGSASYTDPSRSYSYDRGPADDEADNSATFLLQTTSANQYLQVFCQSAPTGLQNDVVSLIAGQSWINIEKIGGSLGGGGGGGGGSIIVEENNSVVVGSASSIDFLGADFTVTNAGGGEADIAIDYAGSNITRSNQNETIANLWTFASGILSTASSTISGGLTVSGIATTTEYLVVEGSATSTFASGIESNLLNITSTSASSTFANGLVLNSGCVLVNGICLGSASAYTDLTDTPSSLSANAIQFANSGATALTQDANFVFDAGTGRLGVGEATPDGALHTRSTSNADIYFESAISSTAGSDINFQKSRGGAAITTGDELSTLHFNGFDGSSFNEGASIAAITEGVITVGRTPTSLRFSTDDLSGSFGERMRITPSGNLGIGTSSPYAPLSVWSEAATNGRTLFSIVDTASSTLFAVNDEGYATATGNLAANILNITATNASSTFGNGLDLTTGCFSIGGSCLDLSGSVSVFNDLTDVSLSAPAFGNTIRFDGSNWVNIATSTLGINLADTDGVLAASQGGTGLSSITNNELLIGGAGNTVTQIATSSLGIVTTDVTEGTNLYFTNSRVDDRINASTTILTTTNEAGLELFLTDVSNIFTNNDGALNDDNLGNNDLADLNNVNAGSVLGNLLYFDGSNWNNIASSSLGLLTSDVTEGSNLYYTNVRVDNRIIASSTIVNLECPTGYVAKSDGVGGWSCAVDLTGGGGGGGSGLWATTTDSLLQHPTDPTRVVIIGAAATSTTGNILEVAGATLFDNITASNVTANGTLTVTNLSTLEYASTTAISSYGSFYIGQTSTTTIQGDGATSTFTGGLNVTTGCVAVSGICFVSATDVALNDLTNVVVPSPSFGHLVRYDGANWVNVATSTLNIALSNTTGTLTVSRGGTGSTTPTNFLFGDGAGALVSTSTISQNFIDTALLRDAEIDTFAEIDSVVSDKDLANLNDVQIFSSELTLAGGYVSQASSTVVGDFTNTGNNIVGGTLDVAGASTLSDTLEVNNLTTLSGGFISGASSTVSGGLTVDGIATTTEHLVIEGSATSTFAGGIESDLLNITSTNASSTFANGLVLNSGCVLVNGTCLGDAPAYTDLTDTPSSLSANAIQFANSGATALTQDTNFVFDATNGRLGVGEATPSGVLHTSSASNADVYFDSDIAGAAGADIQFRKSRGGPAITTGDELSTLHFSGFDGSSFNEGASIAAITEGVITVGRTPTSLRFSTDDLSGSFGERMRITPSGNLGIGTSSPYAPLSVWSATTTNGRTLFNIVDNASTTLFTVTDEGHATATGNFAANILNITATNASSTFGNGISIENGCVLVNGSCLTNTDEYTDLTDTPNTLTANAIPFVNAGGTALTQSASFTFDGTTLSSLELDATSLVGTSTFSGFIAVNGVNSTSTIAGNFEISGNASTSDLVVSKTFTGAGLTDCSATTTKLQWNSSTGQFECSNDQGAENAVTAFDDTGGDAITTVVTVLDLDATTTQGTAYSVDLTADEITFNEDGLYLVMARLSFQAVSTAGAQRARTQFDVQASTSVAGFVDVPGGRCSDYAREQTSSNNAGGSCSVSYVTEYTVGDRLRARHVSLTTTTGNTDPDGSSITVIKLSDELGADFAEIYYSKDFSLSSGEIVAADPTSPVGATKTTKAYQGDMLGVVSTEPGIVIGSKQSFDDRHGVAIALSGRVPMKVNFEGDAIEVGDPVTSSSVGGVGMRARKPGQVIGIALEGYSEEVALLDEENGVSTRIMVFLNPHWYGGDPTRFAEWFDLENLVFNEEEDPTTLIGVRKVVYEVLRSLGAVLEYGALTISDIFADTIVVHNADIRSSVIGSLEVDNLAVNNTFEMVDNRTGVTFCMVLEGGQLVPKEGACATTDNNLAVQLQKNDEPAATTLGNPEENPSGDESNKASNSANDVPIITILGNNPAVVDIGVTYNDLGAIIENIADSNLGIHTRINGVEMQSVGIDTNVPGVHKVEYYAVRQDGTIGTALRTVIVGDSNLAVGPPKEGEETSVIAQESEEATVGEIEIVAEEVLPPSPEVETEELTDNNVVEVEEETNPEEVIVDLSEEVVVEEESIGEVVSVPALEELLAEEKSQVIEEVAQDNDNIPEILI